LTLAGFLLDFALLYSNPFARSGCSGSLLVVQFVRQDARPVELQIYLICVVDHLNDLALDRFNGAGFAVVYPFKTEVYKG
jgi:hypothetical protein